MAGAGSSGRPWQQAWRNSEIAPDSLEGRKKAHSGKVWTTGELPAFEPEVELEGGAGDEEAGQPTPGKGPSWRSRPVQLGAKLQLGEDALEPLPFRRATSTPAVRAASSSSLACRTVSSGLLDRDLEEDFDCDFPEFERRRAVTEPARPKRRPSFLQALFAVDSALPFARKVLYAVDSVRHFVREADVVLRPPAPFVNLLLCVVSLAAGCIFPLLVDLSKTATARSKDGEQVLKTLPYSPASVLQAEAAFNVGLGILAIAIRRSPGGFSPLLCADLHLQMLPLTLIYCLGDIAALCAINHGGGPLYMAITNSRLLVAAGVSHCVLGRRQNRRQWLILAEISLATAAFAVFDAGSKRENGTDSSFMRAAVGTSWALVKAVLSGLAAVLTECRYKKIDLWHANTLLKGQSLIVALVGGALHLAGSDEVPICGTAAAADAAWCVDRRGWDLKTVAVLTAEIGTGWLSVAVLTRMSAVAKFVCKTATAPSLYLFYSMTGFNGFRFDGASFVAVSLVATGILAYTAEPYLAYLRRDAEKLWAGHYTFQQRSA